MTSRHDHWQTVYMTRGERQTSWFRPHLDESLRLIGQLPLPLDAPIIDVGGGRSTLVDDLLQRGYSDLTVLDLSEQALADSRARLGERAAAVRWLATDVLDAGLPLAHFALWHDRAVFHFLADAAERARYREQLSHAVAAGGYAVLATFAPEGPERCSGLPVCRYDAATLAAAFAPEFERIADSREMHPTPFGTEQSFTYVVLRRVR
jgi:SAM-dependent methyltransferase